MKRIYKDGTFFYSLVWSAEGPNQVWGPGSYSWRGLNDTYAYRVEAAAAVWPDGRQEWWDRFRNNDRFVKEIRP